MDQKLFRLYLLAKLDASKKEIEILNSALKSLDAPATEPEAEEPAPKKTTTKKLSKKEVEQTELEAEDVTDDTEESEDDLDLDADEPVEITINEVRQAVKAFALKHGKDKALKLLQKFKTTSISDLKKTDFSKVIELAKKHM